MEIKSLEELIAKIPENFSIPEDENSNFFIDNKESVIDLRKARWLYRELGEFLVYNITSLSSAQSRVNAYNEQVCYDNIKKDKYICKQISELYAKALNMIGIKAVTIEHKQGYDVNHVGTVFEISNGMQFYTDLTLDLINIKTGMQTKEFCNNGPVNWVVQDSFGHDSSAWVKRYKDNVEILNNREISEYIDIPQVNYKVCGLYTESFFERLLLEMKDENLIKEYILNLPKDVDITDKKAIISKYKFDFLLNHIQLENFDYLTGRDFIKENIRNVFNDEERRNFHWFNTNRIINSETEEKEYGTCFLLETGNQNFYYFYKKGDIPKSFYREEFLDFIEKENWQIPKLNEKEQAIFGCNFER